MFAFSRKKTQMESFIGNGNALKYKRGKIMESSMKSIQYLFHHGIQHQKLLFSNIIVTKNKTTAETKLY